MQCSQERKKETPRTYGGSAGRAHAGQLVQVAHERGATLGSQLKWCQFLRSEPILRGLDTVAS